MGGFNILPIGVKNLLIINTLLFFATVVFARANICDLNQWLGLHIFSAPDFKPWQIITYMFMHGNFGHLVFNMFALWMFGAAVENAWGTKKFLIYYLITGIGAALTHYGITYAEVAQTISLVNQFVDAPSIETYRYLVDNNTVVQLQQPFQNNLMVLQNNPSSLDALVDATLNIRDSYLNSFVLIGASGAIYGILLAFGMMFPNNTIYIYFLFPIKAKWFVLIFGLLELAYGILGTSDGVAHFAHFGGMLFGFILIMLWRRHDRLSREQTYYRYTGNDNHVNRSNWRWPFQKSENGTSTQSKHYVSPESGRPLSDEAFNARRKAEKERIDQILDKISQKGYEALSADEKEFLFHYSQK